MYEGGISNYVRPLVWSLLTQKDPNLDVRLIFRLSLDRIRRQSYRKYLRERDFNKDLHFTTRLPDRILDGLWSHGSFLFLPATQGANSFFLATTEMVPRKGAVKVGWIVYDFTPLRIPHFFPGDQREYRAKMRELSRRTDFIVTISKNTKRDLVALIDYPEERILVFYPGVTTPEGPAPAPALPSGRPYIYYLGSLALNKNVDGMLRIFSACVNRHGLDLRPGPNRERIFAVRTFWGRLIRELNLEGRVRITGWISDQVREGYLQNATMLWQFSWYEGFRPSCPRGREPGNPRIVFEPGRTSRDIEQSGAGN